MPRLNTRGIQQLDRLLTIDMQLCKFKEEEFDFRSGNQY